MIQLKKLTKKYGDALILEHTDYDFPQKGIVCLMGASGGGKTTLFNLMAGFDTDYEGEITMGGVSVSNMNAEELCAYRRDNIGFVFQNYHLLPGYTVMENVMLACGLTDEEPETYRQRAKSLLARLGIAEKENQMAEKLSGGQKQRVAIARALINDPQIIFADEPTGALDRKTSTEIMELLREISADKLVLVITHDAKICDFADEVIHISERKIVAERALSRTAELSCTLRQGKAAKMSSIARGVKNFKVHLMRYIAVSIAISIGLLAFLFSLSFGNVMDEAIAKFQEKNTAFNSGYIKGADDGTILDYLNADGRVENVYYQYKLGELSLSLEDKTESMAEKFPGSRATESMSYGVMPREGANEISISPSLAKKFESDIQKLLGKKITLKYGGNEYTLAVSGIFNAGYDDFFVSADVERQFYSDMKGAANYSVSYEVKDFSDIVAVSNGLKLRGIDAQTAADEVCALQDTFANLNKLFLIISVLVLAIGIFICAALLFKLQNSRYHEVGLLSALGFGRRQIASMIAVENALLALLATAVNLALLGCSTAICAALALPFTVSGIQLLLAVAATFIAVTALSGMASYKLTRTEPAEALKK